MDATIWALENALCPTVLIAGGREKGNDYSAILELVRQKVKGLILIGEARQKMKEAFRDAVPIDEAETLAEAVTKASILAHPGDCVLLSPMCKSFDMFSDYEERGRVFKEAVFTLVRR